MRRSLLLAPALLVVAGCGTGDLKAGADHGPCPAGVEQLKVKDVLPEPPLGFAITAPDPKQVAPARDAVRQRLGNRVRSLPARLVVRTAGVSAGTVVFVTNNAEIYDPRELLQGADYIGEQVNAEPQKLTIAGEDGVIAAGPSVVLAGGRVGECAGVTLVGDTEADVRAIAAKIRRAP